MQTFVLTGHYLLLVALSLYGWHRLEMTRVYRRTRAPSPPPPPVTEWPSVTVQLPVYDEKFVIERLIDAAAAIRYPWHRLQIQVLDDSSDETARLAAARIAAHRARGCPIEHLRRPQRTGFKAGALAHGLASARGELVLIFDADFVPDPEVLRKSVGYFLDPGVGMIQMRWDHLNRSQSAFTEAQAISLDAHFMIEHGARAAAGWFFNFNGTAGLWRVATIRDAGGWQSDTLTEDLDLSYCAQLRGWRFLFLPELTSPGELPVAVSAFKSQQHRWAKGATEVMRKILPQVWRSEQPLRTKIEATFHLSSIVAYLLMIVDCVCFLVPSIVIRHRLGSATALWIDLPIFCFATLSHLVFFAEGRRAVFGSLRGAARQLPGVLAFGIGLGPNNARAVVEALFGKRSAFVRTPKRGSAAPPGGSNARGYAVELDGWEGVELVLGVYFLGAVGWATAHHAWAALPVLLLFLNGFLVMAGRTLRERVRR